MGFGFMNGQFFTVAAGFLTFILWFVLLIVSAKEEKQAEDAKNDF